MTIAEDRAIVTARGIAEQACVQSEYTLGDQITYALALEYVNQSLAELHDILTESFTDLFLAEHSFSGTSDDQVLPDGVLRVVRMFDSVTGEEIPRVTLPNLQAARANGGAVVSAYNQQALRYRLLGNRVKFTQDPGNAPLMYYVQSFVRLRDIDDTIQLAVPVDWSRFCVYDVTARLLAREESDYVFWEGRKEELRRKFVRIGAQRDLTPQPIEDREPVDPLEF